MLLSNSGAATESNWELPILEAVLEKIDEGDQCYVVCPAIEKNEDMDENLNQE